MTGAKKLNSISEASGALMNALEGLRDGQGGESAGDVYEFSNTETILYALGGNLIKCWFYISYFLPLFFPLS